MKRPFYSRKDPALEEVHRIRYQLQKEEIGMSPEERIAKTHRAALRFLRGR